MADGEEMVVLVDNEDREIGRMEKLEAHRRGLLHRAISVFVFTKNGEVILQRRALGKYHSGGQWANACCSHPRPGEIAQAAAKRRLKEELGFVCPLAFRGKIRYRAEVGSGLVESELVSVFVGRHDGALSPDPAEVLEWRAASPAALLEEIGLVPEKFAPWLRIYLRDHADLVLRPE